MGGSWKGFRQSVKSRLSALAGGLWHSRERLAEKARRLQRRVNELRKQIRDLQSEGARERQSHQVVLNELREQHRQWEHDRRVLGESALRLPEDLPLGTHGYGARMVSLCVNVAQKVGLRGAQAVLRIVFEWLGLEQKIPDWTTIRNWMQRLGVAALEEPAEPADDWIWMADHSNQIGPEKALVVLGVRASQLPSPGTPLTHADVRVLAVDPDTAWKREDMARAYAELAQRFGAPRAVLWLLDHPAAKNRAAITPERLRDKLGWLREYAADVARWVACQRVVSIGVTFVNEHGLSHGAAQRFEELVASELTDPASREVAHRLTAFLKESESQLRPGERLPLSTEILESSFGLYKQLERQQSKGGFTSLLASFGSLLRPTTPESVQKAFSRISVKETQAWIKSHIPETLTSKRQAAYREFKSTLPRATKLSTTN